MLSKRVSFYSFPTIALLLFAMPGFAGNLVNRDVRGAAESPETTPEAPAPPLARGIDPAPSGNVIAVAWSFDDSPVYRIDESTGTVALVGMSGFDRLNSLARDSSGKLWSVSSYHYASGGELITIDPETGAGTLVAEQPADIRALAFSPQGELYAIRDVDPDDLLVKIDLATGDTILVGPTELDGLQSLAFSPSGVLYGWDSGHSLSELGDGLVILDPGTGAATDVNPAVSGALNAERDGMQSITFDVDGRLLGSSINGTAGAPGTVDELWEIDPSSGIATQLATVPDDNIRGIEFVARPLRIDVMPGNAANPVNPRSRGVTRVVVFGSEDVDLSDVDLTTLRLGPAGARTMHRVDRPFMAMSHLKDVDGDGYTDLDAHFRTDEAGIACGDESVTLIGRTADGTGLQGTDSIRTVGCR